MVKARNSNMTKDSCKEACVRVYDCCYNIFIIAFDLY